MAACSWVGALRVCLSVTILTICLPAAAGAGDAEERAYAENLVRQVWIEGLPLAEAQALGPAGVARLAEMLADPAEREWHGNAIAALGMSGAPQAFGPLGGFAARPLQGEVERPEYRAQVALPFALGHLARTDPRALQLLEGMLESQTPPAWSFWHLSGERLQLQMREACIIGLGLAGRVDKIREIEEAQPEADPSKAARRARHLRSARELAERVTRDGPGRALERSGHGVGR